MENLELTKKLNEIFKEFDTKPVLFFGSGMSKRYYDLPNLENLLKYFSQIIDPNNTFAFQYLFNKAKNFVDENKLADDYIFPYIATLIERKYNDLFFQNSNFEVNIKINYQNDIQNGTSPFKAAVCEFLCNEVRETPTLKDEIRNLSSMINRVSNIITTNYDTFLENLFINYNPLIGQGYVFNNKTSSIGNIFKIHGSIEFPDSIVITYEDYLEFNKTSKFLSAKLLTLFIEYPIVFLGYGINDVNIKAILSDIKLCLNRETEDKISNKMIFVENVNTIEEQGVIEVEIAGVRMQKIKLYDYNLLYKAFDNVLDTIDVSTLRLLEDKITQLVQSSDKSVERVYATGLENKELTSENLAVYIGHETSVFNLGYSAIRLINICEDVLFNNKCYDAEGIINNTILTQKGFFSRSKIPLHKYLSKYDGELDAFYTHNKCIINKIDDVYNRQERKTRLYMDPITKLNTIIEPDHDLNKIIDNIYFSLRKLDITEVKEYIKSIWPRKNELNSLTHLTKIVCVIDLIENKKEH